MSDKWLKTSEAIQYCKDKGRILTRSGLKFLGLKNGFIRKQKDGFHVEYSIDGLNNILKTNSIPDGYITVEEIKKKINKCDAYIYKILKTEKISKCKCGYRKILYFSEKEFFDVCKESE